MARTITLLDYDVRGTEDGHSLSVEASEGQSPAIVLRVATDKSECVIRLMPSEARDVIAALEQSAIIVSDALAAIYGDPREVA